MDILLAAATTFEIQPTISSFSLQGEKEAGSAGQPGPNTGASPASATSQPGPITTLITGVGGLATAWALMRRISLRKPDLIIQAGIAGCFTDRPLGEVVSIGDEITGDLGVWENQRFLTLFDMKFADPDALPFSGGRLLNPYRQLLETTGLDIVSSSSVNEITTNAERIKWYQQNTPAIVESMEGASLHYVCLQENIPFLQLRAISNKVGERDKSRWDIRSAIANLNTQLIPLIENLLTKDSSLLKLS